MTIEEIGKHIKFLRMKNNFTQEVLAKKVSVTRQQIAKMENNIGTYSIDKLLDVLEIFKEQLYIASKEGYDDFVINKFINKVTHHISSNHKELFPKQQSYGWVYIAIPSNDDNLIKIGFTKSNKVEDRIEVMNDDFSYIIERERIELFYTRLTSDCRKVEKEMHVLFKEFNIKGEWFKVNCKVAKIELDKMINKLDTPHLL